MEIQDQQTSPRSRKLVRSITLFNLLIFALFVVPAGHQWVDREFLALRSAHFEVLVGCSLQIWLVGSTLAATALLSRMIRHARKAKSKGSNPVSLKLEKTLVAVWWLAVLGACAYGFMLGMGG